MKLTAFLFLAIFFFNAFADNVYNINTQSIFPEAVKNFINESVQENCSQSGWIYSAYNEEIEDGIYSADLSVGRDYSNDSYIVIKKEDLKQLTLEIIECPQSD